LELHIEQGPILADSAGEIGIVDRIRGVCWIKVTIEGTAGHAGALPMNKRKDAGLMAYKLICETSKFVIENFSESATATVGKLELFPGSSNVVPGKCVFTLDIRGDTSEIIDAVLFYIHEKTNHIRSCHDFAVITDTLNRNDPIFMDNNLITALQKATETAGYTFKMMNSGAGHDAMELASVWKTAMLFVPSIGGITHHPDEFTPFAALEKGAQVLLHMLLDFNPQNLSTMH
jgi:allantoate deiminase